MKNVIHIVERYNQDEGGVTVMVEDLIRNNRVHGVDGFVAAQGSAGLIGDHIARIASFKAGAMDFFRIKGIVELYKLIEGSHVDVVHIHGVWLPFQFYAGIFARMCKKPVVLTAHGMLEDWILNRKGKLNRACRLLYIFLFRMIAINRSALVHAITPDEQFTLARFFPGRKIFLIPNSLNSKEFNFLSDVEIELATPKRILFIGRIHPKKGLILLVEACIRLSKSRDIILDVYGPVEDEGYFHVIRDYCRRFDLKHVVHFHDPVYDFRTKAHLYASSWICVVPSYSEVVGLVNLEASACGCPTITTNGTGLSDWEKGGGLLSDLSVSCLECKIDESLGWSEEIRRERGALSRNYQREAYDFSVNSRKWVEVYGTATWESEDDL
jgi:glycosyltransferase involved in cell wall biosynthesis